MLIPVLSWLEVFLYKTAAKKTLAEIIEAVLEQDTGGYERTPGMWTLDCSGRQEVWALPLGVPDYGNLSWSTKGMPIVSLTSL